MEDYHKINGLYKRHKEGPNRGRFIMGEWAQPEFGYLAKNQWDFTEKVDGTNIKVGYDLDPEHLDRVEFGGRTSRAVIPDPLMEHLESTFTTELFKRAGLSNITLYGEGYGPGIQKGGDNYGESVSFVLFDVRIGRWWLKREDVNEIAESLGIDSVPVIGQGTLQDAIDIVSTGFMFNDKGAVVRYGNGTLTSKWGNFDAEGIVARPVVPMFDRGGKRIIAKIKKVDFR